MRNKNKGKYTRRNFIKKAGIAAAALPFTGSFGLSKEKIVDKAEFKPDSDTPNIILILSDDHMYNSLGFMGRFKFLETPNIDRMASEGAHLQNTFVTTALCSPGRATILTGMYTHKHGVVDNDSPVPEQNIFFPEYLQQRGYETAFIGKWHMGNITDEPRKGFDKWISFKGQGVYYNPELNIDGEKVHREGYITDILTEYAVDYLREKHKKPFCLILSHKAVHAMFEPAERHRGKYKSEKIDYPDTMANTEENYADKPRWVKEQRYGWHGVDYMYHGDLGVSFDDFIRLYCETLLALDESVGNILSTLENTGLDMNSIVFYSSDNGFSLGEHGLIDKRQMYEESIRIPLVVYSPGIINASLKISRLVQNIDFAPTILDLAGIKTPGHMDGKSFLPLLKGEKIAWRDEIYYEYFWERPFPHTPTVFGIRTDKYKYMTYHGIWDIDELYNIENDPDEKHNLISKPEHKDLIRQLNKKVYDWLESTDGMQIPLRRDIFWRADKRKND